MFCPVCRSEYRSGVTHCTDCDADLVAELPKQDWLDKAQVGDVGVFTLDDGECYTAEILDFNDERGELIADVVSFNRPGPHNSQRRRAVPISHIVSFEPQSRTGQPWPHSDPCRGMSFSFARFVLMATLFLSWTIGSVPLFLLVTGPHGFQVTSAIIYTIFVVFFTFARTGTRGGKDLPPYMFTCPAVRTQVSRLLWRHLGFLVALFALQTLALAVRSRLPDWWNTDRGGTPFDMALMLLCIGLAYAQIFTNRRLLERAHREFSP